MPHSPTSRSQITLFSALDLPEPKPEPEPRSSNLIDALGLFGFFGDKPDAASAIGATAQAAQENAVEVGVGAARVASQAAPARAVEVGAASRVAAKALAVKDLNSTLSALSNKLSDKFRELDKKLYDFKKLLPQDLANSIDIKLDVPNYGNLSEVLRDSVRSQTYKGWKDFVSNLSDSTACPDWKSLEIENLKIIIQEIGSISEQLVNPLGMVEEYIPGMTEQEVLNPGEIYEQPLLGGGESNDEQPLPFAQRMLVYALSFISAATGAFVIFAGWFVMAGFGVALLCAMVSMFVNLILNLSKMSGFFRGLRGGAVDSTGDSPQPKSFLKNLFNGILIVSISSFAIGSFFAQFQKTFGFFHNTGICLYSNFGSEAFNNLLLNSHFALGFNIVFLVLSLITALVSIGFAAEGLMKKTIYRVL